jgi:hypothetical protein
MDETAGDQQEVTGARLDGVSATLPELDPTEPEIT